MGYPEEKRPQGRPRTRWADNIKINLGEMGWSDMDWIYWFRIRTIGELL
jgi:hypothetical protein